MYQVTRSLGDSPFHKKDAVSAVPGLCHLPLTRYIRFAVVASDGIWDHLSNAKVAEIVANTLNETMPGEMPSILAPDPDFFATEAISKASAARQANRVDSPMDIQGGIACLSSSSPPSLRQEPSMGKESSVGSLISSDSGRGSEASSPSRPRNARSRPRRGEKAAAACAAVLDYIDTGQASGELNAHTDDRSIVVMIISDQHLG